MRMLRLGRTNVEVSSVSLGTWGHGGPREANGRSVGWSGHDDALSRRALVEAWRRGIDHWDTADVYGDGHAETIIGSVWNDVPRDRIFLATKVGWDAGSHGHFYHPALVRERLERSLRNLRTEVIDLYYFHHCDFGPGNEWLDDALDVVRRGRDEGKIRFIGLSDWNARKIVRIADRIEPDVVQPYRNVVDDDWGPSGLRSWVEKHDAGVAFFSPLKHGLLLGKYTEPTSFPDGDFRQNVGEFGEPDALARYAAAREAVTRRFADHPEPVLHALVGSLLSDAPTGCVLLGQRNPQQVEAAAAVGEALSAEDTAWVRKVYGKGD